MVIQRKQSLFLLIAAILMGIYAFMPQLINARGDVIMGGMCLEGLESIPFFLNCLIALLSFITIFKFKSLKFQKTLCIINILLILASLATGATHWPSKHSVYPCGWSLHWSLVMHSLHPVVSNLQLRQPKSPPPRSLTSSSCSMIDLSACNHSLG